MEIKIDILCLKEENFYGFSDCIVLCLFGVAYQNNIKTIFLKYINKIKKFWILKKKQKMFKII